MTNAEIKFAKSLAQSKNRQEHKALLIEGEKLVKEWMAARADIKWIICTEDFARDNAQAISVYNEQIRVVPYHVLEKISTLSTPPPVAAVVHMQETLETEIDTQQDWHLVLDRIKDPGNLGTIIRLADWMGMKELIITPESVDIYNPKVLQATMGSFLRVRIIKRTLEDITALHSKPLIGTILNGENILDFEKRQINKGFIFMGNESHGLPAHIIDSMDYNITLPALNSYAESLNVAMATSMICSRLIY